jgi:hypothetical protein
MFGTLLLGALMVSSSMFAGTADAATSVASHQMTQPTISHKGPNRSYDRGKKDGYTAGYKDGKFDCARRYKYNDRRHSDSRSYSRDYQYKKGYNDGYPKGYGDGFRTCRRR